MALALTVAALSQNALSGQFDWPQWQGPDRTAISKETGLLKEWPKEGPPLVWKASGIERGMGGIVTMSKRSKNMSTARCGCRPIRPQTILRRFWQWYNLTSGVGNGVFTPFCEYRVLLKITQTRVHKAKI